MFRRILSALFVLADLVIASGCGRHNSSLIPSTSSEARGPQVIWTGPTAHTEYTIPTAKSGAQAITSGTDGNMWFVESTGNKIGRITMTGAITEFRIPTLASQPLDIARGPGNALWFTEYAGNAIGKITTSGVITTYHVPTLNSHPAGITEGPDGNIWFTENSANKVAKLTSSGVFTQYPLTVSNSEPYGITDGPDNKIYFGNLGASYIGRITPSTGAITQTTISGRARFLAPQRSNNTGGDYIWYTDATNRQLGSILTTGSTNTPYSLPSGSAPAFIINGPYGEMWFTDYNGHSIYLENVPYQPPSITSEWTGSANGLAAGPDGNLWTTETSTNKIGVTLPVPTGVLYTVITSMYPNTDPSYIAGYEDLRSSGPSLTALDSVTGSFLAIDVSGYFYTCCSSGPTINTYLPTAYGNPTPWHNITGSKTTLINPTAITVGNNILYVADGNNANEVNHIDAFSKNANGNSGPLRVLSRYGAIAADKNDQLYVQDGNTIQIFSSTASGSEAPLRTIAGSNTNINSSSRLSGVDRNGLVYIGSIAANGDVVFLQFPATANGNVSPERTWDTGYNPSSQCTDYCLESHSFFTDRNGTSYLAWSFYSSATHMNFQADIFEYNSSGERVGDTGDINDEAARFGPGMAVRTP